MWGTLKSTYNAMSQKIAAPCNVCGNDSFQGAPNFSLIGKMPKDRRPYETDDALFLLVLRTSFPKVWQWLLANDCMVCCPQSASLPQTITLEDVQTHVVTQTKIAGEYESLNNKVVTMVGAEMVTQRGYPAPRTVRVLRVDELEVPRAEVGLKGARKLKVVHLSRPFAGGVECPDEPEWMDAQLMRQFMVMMKSHPEMEPVFDDMNKYIQEFNHVAEFAAGGLDRVDPTAAGALADEWQQVLHATLGTGVFRGADGAVPRERRVQLAQFCESYLLGGVAANLFPWHARRLREVDAHFELVAHKLQHHALADVGVAPEFHCSLDEAAAELARLPGLPTPMEKLLCLKRTQAALNRAVQASFDFDHRQGDFPDLTTDELVLLVVATILKAYPATAGLVAQLHYVKTFHFVPLSTSALGFALSHFEVAADWLLAKVGLRLPDKDPPSAQPSPTPGAGPGPEAGGGADPGAAAGVGGGGGGRVRDVALPEPLTDRALRLNLAAVGVEVTEQPEIKDKEEENAKNAPPLPVKRQSARSSGHSPAVSPRKGSIVDSTPLLPAGTTFYNKGTEGFAAAAAAGNSEEEEEGPPSPTQRPRGGSAPGGSLLIFGDAGARTDGAQAQSVALLSEDEISNGEGSLEVAVAACAQQTFMAVTTTGELRTWGLAEGGRLGHGPDLDVFFPVASPLRVTALMSDVVAGVSCGAGHAACCTLRGEVFTWGDNRSGQLGQPPKGTPAGRARGAVPEWLGGEGGEEGGEGGATTVGFDRAWRPEEVRLLRGRHVRQVACGAAHTLALASGGACYSWGRAARGRLGRVPLAAQGGDFWEPGVVAADWSYRVLSLGALPHELVRPGARARPSLVPLRGLGDGGGGEAGRGAPARRTAAATTVAAVRLGPAEAEADEELDGLKVEAPGTEAAAAAAGAAGAGEEGGGEGGGDGGGKGVAFVAAGWAHSVAVTAEGAVFAWGCGEHGRLGLGAHRDAAFPEQLRALAHPALRVAKAAAGYGHTLFLGRDGHVFATGLAKFGQVGIPEEMANGAFDLVKNGRKGFPALLAPLHVGGALAPGGGGGGEGGAAAAAPAPPPPPPVVDVAAGENHSVVRTSGGAVYTWGLNLGDRAAQGRGTQAVPVPTEVPILSGKARAITAGAAHTLVVV